MFLADFDVLGETLVLRCGGSSWVFLATVDACDDAVRVESFLCKLSQSIADMSPSDTFTWNDMLGEVFWFSPFFGCGDVFLDGGYVIRIHSSSLVALGSKLVWLAY